MLTSFQVLFYLKKPKFYLSGPMPIYLRISVDGKRSEISIGRMCSSANWNSHSGRCKGTKEEAKLLNAYIDSLHIKLNIAHQVLVESGKEITVEYLRCARVLQLCSSGNFSLNSNSVIAYIGVLVVANAIKLMVNGGYEELVKILKDKTKENGFSSCWQKKAAFGCLKLC